MLFRVINHKKPLLNIFLLFAFSHVARMVQCHTRQMGTQATPLPPLLIPTAALATRLEMMKNDFLAWKGTLPSVGY